MHFFDHRAKPFRSAEDYRRLAKRRLPKYLFDFIDGGAFNESTKKNNSEDFQKIQLRRRVLKDVSNIDTRVEIFGQTLNQPIILAPVGFAGVYARRGEVQAARAAEKAKIPFSLSSVSICSIDEVKKSTSVPFWYQFYMLKEKSLSLELLHRAKEAECPVLLLTVDLPSIGCRHRYHRSMNSPLSRLDFLTAPSWYLDVRLRGRPFVLGDIAQLAPHLNNLPTARKWMSTQLCSSLTWKDLDWIRANWSGKIVLKGVMDKDDAHLAAQSGLDGLVVSNHGGRHLDSTPSTISILPEIVNAVHGRLDILIDGGITSSIDIVKALALGARTCMIGRAWAFALAARGEAGVSDLLTTFQTQLKVIMTQLGVSRIDQIDQTLV